LISGKVLSSPGRPITLKAYKFQKSKHEIRESKIAVWTLCNGAKISKKYVYATLDLWLCAARKSFAQIA